MRRQALCCKQRVAEEQENFIQREAKVLKFVLARTHTHTKKTTCTCVSSSLFLQLFHPVAAAVCVWHLCLFPYQVEEGHLDRNKSLRSQISTHTIIQTPATVMSSLRIRNDQLTILSILLPKHAIIQIRLYSDLWCFHIFGIKVRLTRPLEGSPLAVISVCTLEYRSCICALIQCGQDS